MSLHRLGYAGPLVGTPTVRWEEGRPSEREEQIVEETPVAIVYNGIPHVVMMATPTDLEDFALGFSLTEELIGAREELERLEVERYGRGVEIKATVAAHRGDAIAERTRRLTGRTGCGICGADSVDAVLKQIHPVRGTGPIRVSAVQRALEALTAQQPLNEASGAVHAAAWATADGALALVREDVGRHNALDKLIGAAVTAEVDPAAGFVVVTSRASFEMVQKATVLGAPLLAAISGPTGLAVRVARESGLTLVGFARRGRLNVYTHAERIVGDQGPS
ncbi:MAG TPA: formate dehydrogenase accessory sulfurtransferase FdhD [Gemmatimonadales bacterium]|nr:formate dehydrogenase accessory sulfurtransferase FdhD [Gemmatimonadales bacterium]